MKGLNKLALAAAISAAPFAQAMESIDDAMLGEMTGQAGVSIELSAQVSIGSVEYTDTDGLNGTAGDAGTVAINNIVLGGNGGGALDEIKIDIDVDAADGLMIHLGGTNVPGIVSGAAPVDFGLSVGSVAINGGNNLISNMTIGGNLGPIDVQIENNATINMDAYFEVTSGSMNVDVLGMGISNLTIGQDSRPFFQNLDGGLVNVAYAGTTVEFAAQDQAQTAYNTQATNAGFADIADLEANGTPAQIAAAQGVRDATYIGVIDAVETGAAGALNSGLSNMAYVGMTITTGDTTYNAGAGAVTVTQALEVSVDSMSMDIAMGVSMGGVGIGNVAINDLDLSGTTMKIYGH